MRLTGLERSYRAKHVLSPSAQSILSGIEGLRINSVEGGDKKNETVTAALCRFWQVWQQSRKWTKLSRVMKLINIHQAKTQLSRLIERVAGGEEIVITKSGKPIARLVPYVPKGAVRRPGAMRGKIRIKRNFDEPLPKEILASFEGKS